MNVIITGASRGLGKAIAERFAKAGYDLYLSSRNDKALQEAVNSLRSTYPKIKIESKAADLSIRSEIQSLAEWLQAFKVEIDVLVNNAGNFIPGGVHNEPEGALEEMIGVNLYSAYHLTRHLLPTMMKRKSGHIFNLCSIASLKAYENGGAYSISKFALLGFTRNLREEMKSYNIKVTAIIPGAAYTDSWSGSNIDPQRIMEAGDIAEIVFTASQLSPQACLEEVILRPQLGDL